MGQPKQDKFWPLADSLRALSNLYGLAVNHPGALLLFTDPNDTFKNSKHN